MLDESSAPKSIPRLDIERIKAYFFCELIKKGSTVGNVPPKSFWFIALRTPQRRRYKRNKKRLVEGHLGVKEECTFEGGFLFFPMMNNILPLQIIPQSMKGGEFGFLGGE